MRRETLEQLIARVNRSAFVPPPEPTAGVRVMAKPVKLKKGQEFTFSSARGGAEQKYPWDEWLTGELLMLEQSEGDKDEKGNVVNVRVKKDFEVDTNLMPAKVKLAGRKRYKVVQVSRKDADGNKLDGAIIIKSRDMTAEERQAEDLLRAEEAEKAKQRRAEKAAESDGEADAA